MSALWAFLNPYSEEDIDKKVFTNFMLLLMNNITSKSVDEMSKDISAMLLTNFESQGITLRPLKTAEESVEYLDASQLEGILEEDEKTLISLQKGEQIDIKKFIGLTDV